MLNLESLGQKARFALTTPAFIRALTGRGEFLVVQYQGGGSPGSIDTPRLLASDWDSFSAHPASEPDKGVPCLDLSVLTRKAGCRHHSPREALRDVKEQGLLCLPLKRGL